MKSVDASSSSSSSSSSLAAQQQQQQQQQPQQHYPQQPHPQQQGNGTTFSHEMREAQQRQEPSTTTTTTTTRRGGGGGMFLWVLFVMLAFGAGTWLGRSPTALFRNEQDGHTPVWEKWWAWITITTTPTSTTPLTGTALGLSLLQRGDVTGAEAVCLQQVSSGENLLWAWTCLGEARLALSDLAWQRRDPFGKNDALYQTCRERLQLALQHFQQATSLDPTEPRARLGHGMALLLLATRLPPDSGVVVPKTALDASLLMEAALHLTAAADLSPVEEEEVHVTALYNAGLAHLAMGAPWNAVEVLQRAVQVVQQRQPTTSTTTTVGFLQATLAGAWSLLEREHDDAARMAVEAWRSVGDAWLQQSSFLGSRSWTTTTTSRPPRFLEASTLQAVSHNVAGMIQRQYQRRRQERQEEEEEEEEGQAEDEEEDDESALTKTMEEEEEKDDNPEDEATAVAGSEMESETEEEEVKSSRALSEAPQEDEEETDPLLKVLESAIRQDPHSCPVWLALAKARLFRGNVTLAVEAAATALRLAETGEEKKQAIGLLETALSPDKEDSDSDKVRRLQMEHDLLQRQVQWLEHALVRLGGNGERTFSLSERATLQHGHGILSNEGVPPRTLQEEEEEEKEDDDITTTSTSLYESLAKEVARKEEEEEQETRGETKEEEDSTAATTTTSQDSSGGDDDQPHDDPLERNVTTTTSHGSEEDHLSGTANPEEETHAVSKDDDDTVVTLPELYTPPETQEGPELTTLASGYMKVADAYMNQSQFLLASKQFARVLKSVPEYLAAQLGLATALERYHSLGFRKAKLLEDVAWAYGNATRLALDQGKVELAGATLERAVQVTMRHVESPSARRGLLHQWREWAFTPELAADMYYVLGREYQEESRETAYSYFQVAHGFGQVVEEGGHGPSLLEMAKVSGVQGEWQEALQQTLEALRLTFSFPESSSSSRTLTVEQQVQAWVVAGNATKALGNATGAMTHFQQALEVPVSVPTLDTAQAHYQVALFLLQNQEEEEDIQRHLETALEIGMELTDEARNFLGDSNPFVLRSIHRAEWLSLQQSRASSSSGGGGVLKGYSLAQADRSVFSSVLEETKEVEDATNALHRIAQGAASYDGQVGDGSDEGEDETGFRGTGQKSSLAAQVKD